MRDEVLMKITGKEVDIFCEVDPTLTEFVSEENGKKILYVQLDKALYGCVQSALLWYKLYSSTLVEMGFTINPYDFCVANAEIEVSQCTICWYVDDNKLSHVSQQVLDDLMETLKDLTKLKLTVLKKVGINLNLFQITIIILNNG